MQLKILSLYIKILNEYFIQLQQKRMRHLQNKQLFINTSTKSQIKVKKQQSSIEWLNKFNVNLQRQKLKEKRNYQNKQNYNDSEFVQKCTKAIKNQNLKKCINTRQENVKQKANLNIKSKQYGIFFLNINLSKDQNEKVHKNAKQISFCLQNTLFGNNNFEKQKQNSQIQYSTTTDSSISSSIIKTISYDSLLMENSYSLNYNKSNIQSFCASKIDSQNSIKSNQQSSIKSNQQSSIKIDSQSFLNIIEQKRSEIRICQNILQKGSSYYQFSDRILLNQQYGCLSSFFQKQKLNTQIKKCYIFQFYYHYLKLNATNKPINTESNIQINQSLIKVGKKQILQIYKNLTNLLRKDDFKCTIKSHWTICAIEKNKKFDLLSMNRNCETKLWSETKQSDLTKNFISKQSILHRILEFAQQKQNQITQNKDYQVLIKIQTQSSQTIYIKLKQNLHFFDTNINIKRQKDNCVCFNYENKIKDNKIINDCDLLIGRQMFHDKITAYQKVNIINISCPQFNWNNNKHQGQASKFIQNILTSYGDLRQFNENQFRYEILTKKLSQKYNQLAKQLLSKKSELQEYTKSQCKYGTNQTMKQFFAQQIFQNIPHEEIYVKSLPKIFKR